MIDFFDFVLRFTAATAAVIGGIWALSKHIIERGLVPAAELDLDCEIVGRKKGGHPNNDLNRKSDLKIVELTVHIHNKGSAVLIAKEVGLVVKCLRREDTVQMYTDERKFGRLQFPHPLSDEITASKKSREKRPVRLVPHNTFVQPSVNQKYSFVTAMSNDVEFIHVHAEFQYAQKPKKLQNFILRLSRTIGLIQYSLHHIYQPHTIQKVFNVKSEDSKPITPKSPQLQENFSEAI